MSQRQHCSHRKVNPHESSRWARSLMVFIYVSILLVESSSSSSSSTSDITTSNPVLDLSYLPHINPATLRKTIQNYHDGAATATTTQGGGPIRVNLGHASAWGDDRLQEILGNEGFITTTTTTTTATNPVQLDVSMNRLTSVGVAWLLHQVSLGRPRFRSLTLDWNNLAVPSHHRPALSALYNNLETLVANHTTCPTELSFCQCSLGVAFCRALGQGLMHRFLLDNPSDEETSSNQRQSLPQPLSLSLSGNPDISDAGSAAIAAALRTIVTSVSDKNQTGTVLQQLHLSACGINDAGAAALALALSEDGCGGGPLVLNLSHNQIKDAGVAALGRAMAMAPESSATVQVLDLSNNEVGISGCTALLVAMARGKLQSVILRSCNIHADVAEVIGKGLRGIALQNSFTSTPVLDIDLSGNPLGVLRGKKKKEGGKYSASRLTSTATATAASYMNRLKKGLRDVGVDTMLGVASPDSDDEDEKLAGEERQEEESEFSRRTCGAKSLVNAFLDDTSSEETTVSSVSKTCSTIRLGLRSCFFDHEAADALAALVVEGKDRYGVDISLDVRMNSVLEEEMVQALHGSDPDSERLREMAERHLDVLEAIKEAEDRVQEARLAQRAHSSMQHWTDPSLSDEDMDELSDGIFMDDDFPSI